MHTCRLVVGLVLFTAGCGSSPQMDMPDMTGASTPDLGPVPAGCAHTVSCTDQSVQTLNLFRTISTAMITNSATGSEWSSLVDATGGGLTPTKAYVYARFTDQGLQRVDVSDEDAFASKDWDIAFRRFIIRLNSGVSGPSCVTGARTATGTTFDGVTTIPDNLAYRTEEYFTATCDYVPDGSGLMSPGTALQSFWEYPQCVKMTNNVFVLQLADGRHVKLVVTGYYNDAVQMKCDTVGGMPTEPSGAGNVKVRWAFVQ
jgi:hypothetical protein